MILTRRVWSWSWPWIATLPVVWGRWSPPIATSVISPSTAVTATVFTRVTITTEIYNIWASSWDYGTYHIGDQRRLRPACASAQSCQSICCLHTWGMKVHGRVQQKIRHLAPLDGCICAFEEFYGGRKVPSSHVGAHFFFFTVISFFPVEQWLSLIILVVQNVAVQICKQGILFYCNIMEIWETALIMLAWVMF